MAEAGSWAGGGLALAFDVGYLAADHAFHGAGGEGEFLDEREFARGLEALDPRECLHRQREQRVARKDGHRVAEDFVVGQFAAAVIVVIERRQVVVNQRIGMDHLERTGRFESAGGVVRDRCGGLQTEHRADPFTAREQAVAHGAMDRFGERGFGGSETVQGFVDESLLPVEEFGERDHFSGRNGSGW